MIYVAWFQTFSFLAALAFLEGYFLMNNSLRLLRLFFMVTVSSFLVVALLPTGSHHWLQLQPDEGGFYPSLSVNCYYEQLGTSTFNRRAGPKVWSMALSILVVIASYLHGGYRLFDPTAQFTRKYFRTWPGKRVKTLLHFLERRATRRGLRASLWTIPHLLVFAGFASSRAFWDFTESMLFEILWLTFAIAWGTVKLWSTRASVHLGPDGEPLVEHDDVLEEDYWTFGQTLPLILSLIPILAMAQTYLDNDAKAADAAYKAGQVEKKAKNTAAAKALDSVQVTGTQEDEIVDVEHLETDTQHHLPRLPQYPYPHFIGHAWYKDHIFLLLLQTCTVVGFFLILLSHVGDVFGISTLLRSRLFLICILGVMPLASLLHLSVWYLAAWTAKACGIDQWLQGPRVGNDRAPSRKWWQPISFGRAVFWVLRMLLLVVLVVATVFSSSELAGPEDLDF